MILGVLMIDFPALSHVFRAPKLGGLTKGIQDVKGWWFQGRLKFNGLQTIKNKDRPWKMINMELKMMLWTMIFRISIGWLTFLFQPLIFLLKKPDSSISLLDELLFLLFPFWRTLKMSWPQNFPHPEKRRNLESKQKETEGFKLCCYYPHPSYKKTYCASQSGSFHSKVSG